MLPTVRRYPFTILTFTTETYSMVGSQLPHGSGATTSGSWATKATPPTGGGPCMRSEMAATGLWFVPANMSQVDPLALIVSWETAAGLILGLSLECTQLK